MMSKAGGKTKCPYMFDGPNIGVDLYEGWRPTLEAACDAVDKLLGTTKRASTSARSKKSTAARASTGQSKIVDKEVEKAITRLLDDVEKETESLCMVCSAPAELKKYNSWVACLCDVHGREHLQKSIT